MVAKQVFVPFTVAGLLIGTASALAQPQESIGGIPRDLRSALVEAVPWIATEEAKLVASNPNNGDSFGSTAAVDGDTAVIGAYFDDHSGQQNAGSAYVFVRDGSDWTFQQRLTPSQGPGYYFGYGVDLEGDTVVVGEGSTGAPSSVYVFVRNGTTWSEQQELHASDPGLDAFGSAVAIGGDTIVVGSPYDDNAGGTDAGSAYVFVLIGGVWIEQQKLVASDATAHTAFGSSVSVSGDSLMVGAPIEPFGSTFTASAYAFIRSGTSWSEQAKLVASDAEPLDYFGTSVSLFGDTALVGSPGDGHAGGGNAGSAYVFVRNASTWSEHQKLTASDAYLGDAFGIDVAISGNFAVIGADGDDLVNQTFTDEGSAYLFVHSGGAWSEQLKLTASDAGFDDEFGDAVGVWNDTVVVGARADSNAGGVDAGSAYVFRIAPGPPVTYCTAGTSASGCHALLSAVGTPSASASSGFSLQANTVEGAKDGMFFWGTNGQQANPWGNGTSYQCIAPPVTRGGLLAGSGTTAACDGAFAQDLNAVWCHGGCPYPQKNPGAGATVQAQLWYRDPLNTSNQTTSFSDAIEFAVGP